MYRVIIHPLKSWICPEEIFRGLKTGRGEYPKRRQDFQRHELVEEEVRKTTLFRSGREFRIRIFSIIRQTFLDKQKDLS